MGYDEIWAPPGSALEQILHKPNDRHHGTEPVRFAYKEAQ